MVKNTNYAIVSGGNAVKIPKKYYQNCNQKNNPYKIFLYGAVVLLVAVLIIFFVGLPILMRHVIKSQIHLKRGTIMWDLWQSVPVPIYIKIINFNITNPNAIENGEKFKLEEFGPYVFEERRTREIVDVNEDEDTVTYNEVVNYFFRPELSNGTLDDAFTIVNPMFISVATLTRQYLSGLANILVRMIEDVGETFTKKNVTIREMAFDGIKLHEIYTPLVNIGPGDDVTEYRKGRFGYLLNINGSSQGQFKIKTGIKDPSTFGKIVSWNGLKELNYWTDPSLPADQQYCNKINGSDGTANLPLMTRDKPVYIFHPYICRSLHFLYHEDAIIHGINVFKLKFPKDLFASPDKNPDNQCFCSKGKDRCVNGGYHVGQCKKDARIFITKPHFFEGEQRFIDGVEGMRPNPSLHDTEVYVEPVTGVPVKVLIRLQVNIEIKPIPGMPSFDNLTYTMLPLVWVEVTADLPENYIKLMKEMFLNKEAIVENVKWAVTGLCVIFVLVGFFMIGWRRTRIPEHSLNQVETLKFNEPIAQVQTS